MVVASSIVGSSRLLVSGSALRLGRGDCGRRSLVQRLRLSFGAAL